MSAARVALRWVCHATVAVWIAAYLVAMPPAIGSEASEPMDRSAQVRPLPREPEPPPPPDPVTASAPGAAEPRPVGAVELAQGSALLENGGDFPALHCSYEDFASFREYARAMVDLGARFVVVLHREVVGSVDVETGNFGPVSMDGAFSPRARDYTDERGLVELAGRARRRYGEGAVVMMLVPRRVDAGLFGGIAGALAQRGEAPDAYREIRGRYLRGPGGGIRLQVDAGVGMDGVARPLDLLFDLTEIARARVSAAGAPA